MSVTSCYADNLNVQLSRVKALEEFTLFDREAAVHSSDSCQGEEIKVVPGSAIIVTGYIPFNAVRFAVNLICKSQSENVALHLNPRLERGYIVRNSRSRNKWQEEETCSSSGKTGPLFHRNSYFHMMIFCTSDDFQVAINGEHFCSFAYRMPLSDVNQLQIHGDVEDVRTRVTTFSVYPDPEVCPPKFNHELSDNEPLKNNLEIPVTVFLRGGVKVGTRILIKGRLKLLPHSFYVNLQKGKMMYPHPEIGLHLNPRFFFGGAEPCVIMNCWRNGSWEHEERHEGVLSWMPGREFLLTLSCEYEAYTIWLGDKMIGEFRHRVPFAEMDTLRICGDIVLYELSISHT